MRVAVIGVGGTANLARTLLTHVCRYRWQTNAVLTRQSMSAGAENPG